ncbi:hypothetical protein PMIN07_012538 [Paraphaeosphaeria minitans]
MGSAVNNATAFLIPRDCTVAATASPNPARPFGPSQTDASFAALLGQLLAEGPP